jgi:hypothetical protein
MKERAKRVSSAGLLADLTRACSAAIGVGAHDPKPKPIPLDAYRLPRHMHHNRAEIREADLCGCISCEQIFQRYEIERWVGAGTTAVCPRCDTAAVVGSGSGFELTPELLHRAHQLLFEGLGLRGSFLHREPQKEKAHRGGAPSTAGDNSRQKTTTHRPNPSSAPGLVPSSN